MNTPNPTDTIPGPQGWELWRMIPGFRRDPLRGLLDVRDRYGDILQYRYGSAHRVLISDPEAAMRVLVDNHTNYNKDSPFYHMLKWFFGEGMLASDGELWKRQRRLAQPAFARRKTELMAPMMVDCTEEAMEQWESGASLDAAGAMGRLTLRVIGRALFHEDLSEQGESIGVIAKEYQRQMLDRFRSIYPIPPVLPTAKDRRFRYLRAEMIRRVQSLISRRLDQDQHNWPEDLLTSLLRARDEDGTPMPHELMCQELMTFLLTGYETVASTLGWVFVLLSRHPDVRRRLELEVQTVLGQRSCTVADLPRLPLSERILLETMRLYPPVCVFGRRSIGPDCLAGYPIPARQIVSISPFLLHRHPRLWDNPEGFDPDRFLEPPCRGAYLPFALGPRQCIGAHFALMEARLILCTIARKWRLNLVSGARIVPEPLISLQPRFGVPVVLQPIPAKDPSAPPRRGSDYE